jgi:N6-adenosine-specific RNA methylase IME4
MQKSVIKYLIIVYFALGDVSHGTARLASGSRSAIVASPVAEESKRPPEWFGAAMKLTHTHTHTHTDDFDT